ncbi:hypothetical protein HHE02_04570 [Helicobacter heilmannii]|uniref:Uncharacterized protein n=1 Tax=Helicobacter heilmannii TaxID=35817 RepID=A0A0K2XQQ2_HELHE|nr:hypothetical protein [Helicobacter heilmannii]BDQ26814.1 hypothetical protein ASB1_04900 [Helicobacter heilmannii]CCM73507.1 hypothetical protein BN341_9230 [Helicobacter heilmannii ASB1.4]CRF47170.1 hypothetical protein HHE02_04570 [Helicobacter heilmannii]CRI35073.1 hypothetical protein HHE01_00710 [Helicobacter heilmannii]
MVNVGLKIYIKINFYNEIDRPQQRGMFQFFDCAFIGKPIDRDFIKPLSHLITYIKDKL